MTRPWNRRPAPGRCLALPVLLLLTGLAAAAEPQLSHRPNILIITIDTLRADRVSAYGYDRPTTPHLDRLIASGVRFTQARTVEPLTGPALASMITSLHPHEHGASRNGLRMRTGLASLPKTLQAHGYATLAFVGNWTLRDRLSGLAEHFEHYNEVLTRKRWFGLVRREATAVDITDAARSWLGEHLSTARDRPFCLWVHYVEPHAPYRLHREYVEQLGLSEARDYTREERYDTEIAFVDASIGELLAELERLDLTDDTLIVFASDHGESLGEHDYWGHGRNLYEPTLLIPLAISWPGRITAVTLSASALNLDIAPTILGLLGAQAPATFRGFDWSEVLTGRAAPPAERLTRFQAHRGAVISKHNSDLARRSGLLEVGILHNNRKEIFRVPANRREFYDLNEDPRELSASGPPKTPPSEGLLAWMRKVYDGLTDFEDSPPEPLDAESIEQLRSLGYVD